MNYGRSQRQIYVLEEEMGNKINGVLGKERGNVDSLGEKSKMMVGIMAVIV